VGFKTLTQSVDQYAWSGVLWYRWLGI